MYDHPRGAESLRNNKMAWTRALEVDDLIMQRDVCVEDGVENYCEGEMREGKQKSD